MPVYSLRRRKEISQTADRFRNTYAEISSPFRDQAGVLDPILERQALVDAAERHDILVHRYNWLLVPCCVKNHIFLPYDFSPTSLTHEVGHSLLDTSYEREANYFSRQVSGSFARYLRGILDAARGLIRQKNELTELYLKDPQVASAAVEHDLKGLQKMGFPEGLEEVLAEHLFQENYARIIMRAKRKLKLHGGF